MRTFVVAALAVACLTGADSPPRPEMTDGLQGTWELTSVEWLGEECPEIHSYARARLTTRYATRDAERSASDEGDPVPTRLTIRGRKSEWREWGWRFNNGGCFESVRGGKARLAGGDRHPVLWLDGPMLVEVHGDRLRLCGRFDGKTPESFDTTKDDGVAVLTFRRIKG